MTPGDRERAENYDEWKKKTLQLEKYGADADLNARYTARPSLAKQWTRNFSVDGARPPASTCTFFVLPARERGEELLCCEKEKEANLFSLSARREGPPVGPDHWGHPAAPLSDSASAIPLAWPTPR